MKTLEILIQSGITWIVILLFCRYSVWPIIDIFLTDDTDDTVDSVAENYQI